MLNQGTVANGAQPTSLPIGTVVTNRMGQQGEQIATQLQSPYYEQTYRKNRFYAYVTGQTLTASNTTYTGLGIANNSSTVNLVLEQLSVQVSVTSASMTGIALGVSTGQTAAPTGVTAATQTGNTFITGPASQGLAFKAATLANAGIPVFLLTHNTAAIATTGVDATIWDMQGSIIIPPGCTAHLLALGAASAANAVTASFIWSEIPV